MELIKVYTKDEVVFEGTAKEVAKWIGYQAFSLNYGMMRTWGSDGLYYYDCGPITYYTTAKF